MKAGWISLAALGLVAAVAATSANGANNHHHHNGHHHGHKVKGVIVNVAVSVDFIHRVDDTFKNQNGGCGSGDPEEDFDPVETHTVPFRFEEVGDALIALKHDGFEGAAVVSMAR